VACDLFETLSGSISGSAVSKSRPGNRRRAERFGDSPHCADPFVLPELAILGHNRNVFGEGYRDSCAVKWIVVVSGQSEQPHGMLGADRQYRQLEVRHQCFQVPTGEQGQTSVGLDGNLDEGNRTHDPDGIRVFEEALDLWCERQIRNACGDIVRGRVASRTCSGVI
jgi:hypothetical protein